MALCPATYAALKSGRAHLEWIGVAGRGSASPKLAPLAYIVI